MEQWKLEPAHDLGMPLAQRLRSVRRESGLFETGSHLLWWGLVRLYLRVYHRLEVEGIEHIPARPPFVLASNHASHLDALVLASQIGWRLRDRVHPIAAGDTFFDTPVAAAFAAAALNALPMSRQHAGVHALQHLRDRLVDECCIYILFPEGTRTRDGSMRPFKSGIGMLLAGTSVPVVPCHLTGTFEALPPDRRFPRPTKIRLRIGPPIQFEKVPKERDGWDVVARRVEDAVRGLELKQNRISPPLPFEEGAKKTSVRSSLSESFDPGVRRPRAR